MPITLAKQAPTPLWAVDLPFLTTDPPLAACRICVVVPVRNEAEHLPAMLGALACQVDAQGRPLDPDSYEVLVLANNCNDGSAAIARALGRAYPTLKLQVLEVTLPKAQAHVGQARRMVMNEAYRRLSLIGRDRRIIASTDGDTEVSSTWLASMLNEFDRGVDAVGGRILTRRTADMGINSKTSLYFLRYMAHEYFIAELEAFLDPLPHDCWPRHSQHYGANLAVSAEIYGRVGGVPNVPDQEDVALYRSLQRIDAKIRHSPNVQVMTSARQIGRASGGLAERLTQLALASRQRQAFLVESPWLTEARILVRQQLRQIWMTSNSDRHSSTMVRHRARKIRLIAKSLGLSEVNLRQKLEAATTFGWLIETIEAEQKQRSNPNISACATTEVSLANMHLRQRLLVLRQQATVPTVDNDSKSYAISETLQQIQSVPFFSLID